MSSRFSRSPVSRVGVEKTPKVYFFIAVVKRSHPSRSNAHGVDDDDADDPIKLFQTRGIHSGSWS